MLDLPDDLPWVTLDTESGGLFPDDGFWVRVASVALAAPGGWRLALPFDQGARDKLVITQMNMDELLEPDPNLGKDEWYQLLGWLQEQRLVFHNAKHDLKLMAAGTRHWDGVDLEDQFEWDTMLAAREIHPTDPVGLDAVAQRLGLGKKTGKDEFKAWLRKRKYPATRYDLVPWRLMEKYVTADAVMTRDLYEYQQRRYEAGEFDESRLQREFEKMKVLYRMEQRGVQYDSVRSQEAAEVLKQRADEIEARMPFKCDINEAKRYFFEEVGFEPDRVTEKRGDPVLDEEQVRRWISLGVPWASEYALVSKARRAVSMWYEGYPEKMGADGRLRTSFKQAEVKSGRMSVERVQLQAMPKSDKYVDTEGETLEIYDGIPGVRDLLQAKPGHGLWNLDLSQAELRVAAKYSRCNRMLEMLLGGADLHGVTCETVLGVSRDAPDWKTKRDIAKRLTFGSIFMIGGKTFQATLSKLANIYMPLGECERLVYNWRRMYPEFEHAYKRAMRKAEKDKWVRILPGTRYERRSWFGPRDWPNTAWNRTVQGSLAEFFGMWMVEVEKQAPGAMILTVHDSVLLECRLDEGPEIAAEVAQKGAEFASEVFGLEMKVDTDVWYLPGEEELPNREPPPDKASKEDDSYAGVSGS